VGARRMRMITGIKPRVGLVRNSHIDRALRMEAGAAFRIIVVERASVRRAARRLVSLPPWFSLSRPRSPRVLRRAVAFPVRSHRVSGSAEHRVVVSRDKIIELTMRRTRSRDPSCVIAKLFRGRFHFGTRIFFALREAKGVAFSSLRVVKATTTHSSSGRNSSFSRESGGRGGREEENSYFSLAKH